MIWYESAEEDFRREKGDIESNEKKIRNRNYEEEAAILNQSERPGSYAVVSF